MGPEAEAVVVRPARRHPALWAAALLVAGALAGTLITWRLIDSSPTSTPAPTPMPTPSSTYTSVAGFPGPDDTGVPPGTVLRQTGPMIITEANTVVDGMDIAGPVDVRAPGVVIKNSRITGTGRYGVLVRGGSLTIQDSEITGGFEVGIAHDNWTALRMNIHGMSGDGVKLGTNAHLEDSWIHDFVLPTGGAHPDAAQLQAGATNVVVRHNTLDIGSGGAYQSNAAIIIKNDLGPSSEGPVLIEDNFLDSGMFTVFIVAGNNNGVFTLSNITFRDNKFGRNFRYGSMAVNIPATMSNNTYLDTGETVPVDPGQRL